MLTISELDPAAETFDRDCRSLAAEIVPQGQTEKEELWALRARQILSGLIMHIAIRHPIEERTLQTLARLVEDDTDKNVQGWLLLCGPDGSDDYRAAMMADLSSKLHRFIQPDSEPNGLPLEF